MVDYRSDTTSIQWIRDEIENNTEQAIHALEHYFSNGEVNQLAQAKEHIHQIYGTLQIVELYPPSTLAHEIESTFDYLIREDIEVDPEAVSQIIQCISLIIRYVDGVLRKDQSISSQDLLSPLNVLRKIRNESEVATVSGKDSYFDSQKIGNDPTSSNIQALAKKLLKLYQYSYLRFSEENSSEENFNYMVQSIERFSRLFTQQNLTPLWSVIIATCHSLKLHRQYKNEEYIGDFFGKLMHLLHSFSSSKTREINGKSLTNIFIQGLSILDNLTHTTESAKIILQNHQDKIQSRESGGQNKRPRININKDLSHALSDALVEEISYIKDSLDLFSRNSNTSPEHLRGLHEKLRTLSDSMILIEDLEIPRQSLDEQIIILDKIITTSKLPTDDWLINLATSLLFVESSAINIKKDMHQRMTKSQNADDILTDAKRALITETLSDLSKVKSLYVECISATWDISLLNEIRDYFQRIEFALFYIDETQAMRLLESISKYISQDLVHRTEAPPWDSVEEFADIVAALDQYLYLRLDAKHQSPKLLEMAQARLDALFSITDENLASSLDVDSIRIHHLDHQAEMAREVVTANPVEPNNLPSQQPSTPADMGSTDVSNDIEIDDDQEIKEIFREEVSEIVEELDTLLVRISKNIHDAACLSSIRRLIHTLKGSGKMANMPIVHEPAWALESVLNELLDQARSPSLRLIKEIKEFICDISEMAASTTEHTEGLSKYYKELFGGNNVSRSQFVANDSIGRSTTYTEQDSTELESDQRPNDVANLQFQEICNHLNSLSNYYDTYQSTPEHAPVDEQVLRSTHTLKALLLDSGSEALATTFAQFEKRCREVMGHESQTSFSFFSCLGEAIKTVRAFTNHNLNDSHIESLEHSIETLSAVIGELAPEKPMLEHWLDTHSQILDYLIRNEWLCESGVVHEDLIDLFQSSIQAAQQSGLVDVVAIVKNLRDYSVYFRENINLFSIIKEDIVSLREGVLEFADHVALGKKNPDLSHLVELSNNKINYLKQLIQQQQINVQTHESQRRSQQEPKSPEDISNNPELLQIFRDELLDILESIDQQLYKLGSSTPTRNNLYELQRDYHTIKGSAHYIGEKFISILAHEADLICERFLDYNQLLDTAALSVLVLTQNLLRYRLDKIPNLAPFSDIENKVLEDLRNTQPARTKKSDKPHDPELQDGHISDLETQLKTTMLGPDGENTSYEPKPALVNDADLEVLNIFIEEAEDLLTQLDKALSSLDNADTIKSETEFANGSDIAHETVRILHTIKGGARLAGIQHIGDIAGELERAIDGGDLTEVLAQKPNLEHFSTVVKRTITHVYDHLKQSQAGAEPVLSVPCHEEPSAEPQSTAGDAEQQTQTEETATGSPVLSHETEIHQVKQEETFATNPNALSPTVSTAKAEEENLDDYDPEILEIFYEESKELADDLEKTITSISGESIEEATMDQLKRILHTVKGSARLAGFAEFGNQTHLFESYLEQLSTPTTAEATAKVILLNDELFDSLNTILDLISRHLSSSSHTTGDITPTEADSSPHQVGRAEMQPRISRSAKRRKNTEAVRIGADLLERLVNLAGETVIARSSVQQELSGFNSIIDEFSTTLSRLREQIRNFESETESRMLSRNTGSGLSGIIEKYKYDDFDSLELDRFSSFHQLARSLSESASDLHDMRDSMIDKVRTTEGLVMQQSRVQTQLHEGLMLSRMVPFSRLAPRLSRMVRQVADELGKKATLDIINAEGEMDRSVLERMVPPLEHMLRNSLDHGIETPDVRANLGKPETGKIVLHLFREGNEIVLRLSDDGAGIDVGRVRQKAIENKLLAPNADLSEKEILQFIFKPGFSTATTVTQISGRGVGMDVVFSEIKQLGGSLKLHAAPNVGTQFTIRIPFTVSMSRALMVKLNEQEYAIPLTHIEGVVRVSPYELNAIYRGETDKFIYAQKEYEVKYLGDFLNYRQRDTEVKDSVPLLLARNAERAIAVQVDALIGSREVVIKNPGPQLSQVVGLSGATILGDGSVVIILDLNALIRDDIATIGRTIQNDAIGKPGASKKRTNPLIMVVDDSVTVRKVTSRLLERHGIDVVTAKDGIDAVTQLRDITPNLILLDIEMPRMDGFEVASHIRHDPQLRDTPILMISSRTGDKHRSRAKAVGVNNFLGKPYQEMQLLEIINELMEKP